MSSEEKYLIFDFDGVIGNTQATAAKATALVNNISLEEAAAANITYSSNIPDHTRAHTLTTTQLQKVYDWTVQFGTNMHKIGFPLFDAFVQEVEQHATKHKAIVSSGSQIYVIPAIANTNINPTHMFAYENHHSKEEKIETICNDWGVDVSEVYYFTDTLADVYELQNFIAKDKLIGVAWGYCGKELLLQELKEQYILDTPQDIHKVL